MAIDRMRLMWSGWAGAGRSRRKWDEMMSFGGQRLSAFHVVVVVVVVFVDVVVVVVGRV